MNKKRIATIIAFAVAIALLVFLAIRTLTNSEIPISNEENQINSLFETFLTAVVDQDADLAVSYLYFPDKYSEFYDMMHHAYSNRPVLLSYEIESVEKTDNDFFEINYSLDSEDDILDTSEAKSYVKKIEGEWKIILNREVLLEIDPRIE